MNPTVQHSEKSKLWRQEMISGWVRDWVGGMYRWSPEDFGEVKRLYDTIMVDTCHHTFV